MEVKLAFGIPIVAGIVGGLIIGIRSNWSTGVWALIMFLGILNGVVFGLVFHKHKTQGGIRFTRRSEDLPKEEPLLTNIIVGLIIFVGSLVAASLPISGKRGILLGERSITNRTMLTVGALLVGMITVARLVKWLRNRRGQK